MKYMTRAIICAETAERLNLHDDYGWHQIAWLAFPGRPSSARHFLTRIDYVRDQVQMLILSPDIPVRPEGWVDSRSSWETLAIRNGFLSSKYYSFKVRACPTKRDKTSGRRVALKMMEECEEWLIRKIGNAGCEVDQDRLSIAIEGYRSFTPPTGCNGAHYSVDYCGILTVSDREKFTVAHKNGIGTAKAYGYGMLLLSALQ